MHTFLKQLQALIDEIDLCIRRQDDTALTLQALARKFGYSEYHVSRKFREVSGMRLRDYLRGRRLAFALKDLRDSSDTVLSIAVKYGFSSNEAFSRAFRKAYGVSPAAYRKHPVPVKLQTVLRPFDCWLMETAALRGADAPGEVKTYFVSIPAHKFLHIRCYESIGYWDFWQKQAAIPGRDCETVCGLLDGIPGKLDDLGSHDLSSGSGQIMAFLNAPEGRICSWGIPLAECYGVRLPADYSGPVPEQMLLTEVPAGDYLVFEHGPFDFTTQNGATEQKMEAAMAAFDYEASGYRLDVTPGRFFYFFHDETRFWKYIRPVTKV